VLPIECDNARKRLTLEKLERCTAAG
jgi:hypothetical protein